MSQDHEAANQYISFSVQNNRFAVPMSYIEGIVPVSPEMQFVMPPHAPAHVKGIIKLNGMLLTVMKPVEGLDDAANLIVVLTHKGKNIGLLAHTVDLNAVDAQDLAKDLVSGVTEYIVNGTHHVLVDVPKLYADIGA